MRRADRLFQIVQHLRGGRLVTARMLSRTARSLRAHHLSRRRGPHGVRRADRWRGRRRLHPALGLRSSAADVHPRRAGGAHPRRALREGVGRRAAGARRRGGAGQDRGGAAGAREAGRRGDATSSRWASACRTQTRRVVDQLDVAIRGRRASTRLRRARRGNDASATCARSASITGARSGRSPPGASCAPTFAIFAPTGSPRSPIAATRFAASRERRCAISCAGWRRRRGRIGARP